MSRSWKIPHGIPSILRIKQSLPKASRVTCLPTRSNWGFSPFSGRLESLVNFQTMIMSLTAMDIANSSMLDEATAAAEAMVMALVAANHKRKTFFVDNGVLPQTLAVLKTRAKGFGIRLVVGDAPTALGDEKLRSELCGVLLHYPDVNGQIKDFGSLADSVHAANALVAVSMDLLALTMGGECSADIVFGNSAQFGVPAGYGGPHG